MCPSRATCLFQYQYTNPIKRVDIIQNGHHYDLMELWRALAMIWLTNPSIGTNQQSLTHSCFSWTRAFRERTYLTEIRCQYWGCRNEHTNWLLVGDKSESCRSAKMWKCENWDIFYLNENSYVCFIRSIRETSKCIMLVENILHLQYALMEK
jgi:hypothetical protein